jgi:hypothetical protein
MQARLQPVSSWQPWNDSSYELAWQRPATYDEILTMLEQLESGELERRYSVEQLERITSYIATLA